MRYLILLLLLCGCYTEKKAKRQFDKAALSYPVIPAEYCANEFPVKDSIIVKDSIRRDTVLDVVFWGDSIFVSGDTVYKVKTVYKTITNTVRKDSIIYRRDGAEERRLQLSLQACQGNANDLLNNFNKQTEELAQWRSTAKKRFWWIFALIGGAVVYAGIKLKKYFLV